MFNLFGAKRRRRAMERQEREDRRRRGEREREQAAAEYGKHVHHEGHDEDEYRILPCICSPPHSHRKTDE